MLDVWGDEWAASCHMSYLNRSVIIASNRSSPGLPMFTGKLFHRVAAAYPNHLIPYVASRVYGTVNSVSYSDIRIVLDHKQKQVPPSSDGQSHLRLYMHKPGSSVVTSIWLEANVASSRLVLYADIYGCWWLAAPRNSVFSVVVPPGSIICHNPVEMLSRHVPMSSKYLS